MRATDFIESRGVTVRETVKASGKRILQGDEAWALVTSGSRLVAAKRGKVASWRIVDGPDRVDVEALTLGATGNLRAPTALLGRTVLVGFDPEAWANALS